MCPLVLALLVGIAPAATVAVSFTTALFQGEARQSASGIVIAEDVAGHILVYDKTQRVLFEMDKEAGRPVRIGVGPGSYEVRLDVRREALRITVEVREGEYTIVDRDRFAVPTSERTRSPGPEKEARPPRDAEAKPAVAPKGPRGDAMNRIEVRFGVYPEPLFTHSETVLDVHTSTADVGLGVEYLRSLSRDLAIGAAVSTRTRTERNWVDYDHDDEADHDRDSTRTSNSTTFVAAVIRWNFARRLTEWHAIEPYVTGSLGPVFRTNSRTVERYDDRDRWSETATSVGGRLGVGFDAHLGRVFTLGAVGAWNWSTCPDEEIGYGSTDRGGEVAVTMGFEWGRWARGRQ
jgi:hypothetical protein